MQRFGKIVIKSGLGTSKRRHILDAVELEQKRPTERVWKHPDERRSTSSMGLGTLMGVLEEEDAVD